MKWEINIIIFIECHVYIIFLYKFFTSLCLRFLFLTNWCCIFLTRNMSWILKSLYFYFRGTLRVKEVLQSSKFSTCIFLNDFSFYITPTVQKCVLEKIYVCVCVCVSVWPSPNVESKPIDWSRSNSIYRVLSKYLEPFF